MKKFYLSILLCLLSLNLLAQPVGKDEDIAKKYLELVSEQSNELQSFNDKVMKGSLCSGFNLPCLKEEMKKREIKTSFQLVQGMAMISLYVSKAKELKKDQCDNVCKMSFGIELLDLVTDYISKFDLKKLYAYSDLPSTPETRLLRAQEDMICYKFLQGTSARLESLYASIVLANTADSALYAKLHSSAKIIMKLPKITWFLDSELARANENDLKTIIGTNAASEKEDKAKYTQDLFDYKNFLADVDRAKSKTPQNNNSVPKK